MPYDHKWRQEDEQRIVWLEKLYGSDGRRSKAHPMHGLYTGLVEKWGALPWKVN